MMAGSIAHSRPGPPFKGTFWVMTLALVLVFPSVLAAGIPRDSVYDDVKPVLDSNDLVNDGTNALVGNHFEARQNHGTTILFTVTVFVTPAQPSTVIATAKEGPSTTTTVSQITTRPTTKSTFKGSTLSTLTVVRSSSSSILTSVRSSTSLIVASSSRSSSSLFQPPLAITNNQRSAGSTTSSARSNSSSSATSTISTSSTSSTSSRITSTSTSSPTSAAQPTFVAAVGAETVCVERLKIEDMQTQRPDSFNLLLLAWGELQLTSETDDLSFYQLSRIHGAPFGPWQMPEQGNYNWEVGYCTHHSVIFLTWHRPFLLLLEQTIYRKAREIANRFSADVRPKYQAAVNGLRLPYWDWSDPNTQSHIPTIVTAATVSVTQPGANGAPVVTTIPNPLKSYTFQSADSIATFWQNFARWRTTLRQPTSDGVTQEDLADRTLQNGYTNRRQSTYLAFSQGRYNDFAASIESIHDEVHAAVGGQGHMTYVPYSAYDPIFWLHHCNMDRLMAMYQSAQPNTFIEPGNSVATFANPSSQLDTVDTPLYPFRHRDSSWWTSQNVSTVNTVFSLSYGYPEVPCPLSFSNFDTLRNHTITEINRLYGPAPVAPTKRDVKAYQMRQEWQAKIVIDQAELLGSFTVFLFLGTPPTDPAHWATCPTMIGTLAHLGSPEKRMYSRVIGTHVVLTDTVHENLGPNPTKEQVLNYIRENINWAILSGGKPVNVPQLHTLRVTCVSTEVTMPTCPNELPKKGTDTYHLEVTAGKPGGSKSDCDVNSPFQIDGKRVGLPSHISITK
ncbi:Tyosinase C-terminal domain [Arthrobotrys flagrans]|uniref:tyrosinase n=1 Tax=Arthrobotrys flagrans TaxID=97331 RepID=A0A436ZY67_ARTFL|nr:Tyosinase C-terminal domain [Arthrobotrys flagrans]